MLNADKFIETLNDMFEKGKELKDRELGTLDFTSAGRVAMKIHFIKPRTVPGWMFNPAVPAMDPIEVIALEDAPSRLPLVMREGFGGEGCKKIIDTLTSYHVGPYKITKPDERNTVLIASENLIVMIVDTTT